MSGIFRVQERRRDFATIKNEPLNDKRLTFGARGLLAYLLSKPDHWEVRMPDLLAASPAGLTAIRAMLRELEDAGYLVRVRHQDSVTGKFSWESNIYETPRPSEQQAKPSAGFPPMVEPSAGFPSAGNPSAGNLPIKKELRKEITERVKTEGIEGRNEGASITSHPSETSSLSSSADTQAAEVVAALQAVTTRPLDNAKSRELMPDVLAFILAKTGGDQTEAARQVLARFCPEAWAPRTSPPNLSQIVPDWEKQGYKLAAARASKEQHGSNNRTTRVAQRFAEADEFIASLG